MPKFKAFLFLSLFITFSLYAEEGIKPIVIGAYLIFTLLLMVLIFLFSFIHFYITRRIFSSKLGYYSFFKYSFWSALCGLLFLVLFIPKDSYTEGNFLIIESISMILFPILILLKQRLKGK